MIAYQLFAPPTYQVLPAWCVKWSCRTIALQYGPEQESHANCRRKGAAEYFWDSPAFVITSEVKTILSTGWFITLHFKPVDSLQDSDSDYIQWINIRDFCRVMANCPAEFTHIPLDNPSHCPKLSLSLTYCLLIWILSSSSFTSAPSFSLLFCAHACSLEVEASDSIHIWLDSPLLSPSLPPSLLSFFPPVFF